MDARLDKVRTPPTPAPELVGAVQKGDEAYRAGRWAEARRHYERVLAVRPDLAPGLHELIARSYSQERNYEKSLEHMQHVLDANPDNTSLRVAMAEEAVRGGMLDKAQELLKSVDEESMTSAEVFYNIGVLLRRQAGDEPDAEDLDPAIGYFSKAIALDAAHVDSYLQRGLAYRGQNKTADARADLRKVVELAPAGSPAREGAEQALAQLER